MRSGTAISTTSLPFRLTGLVVWLVAVGIVVMACLGYFRLADVTAENSGIRIDRAAKAAANILAHATDGTFGVDRAEDLRPKALRLSTDQTGDVLRYSDFYDQLLAEIGGTNQGAANLFVYNDQTNAFDRFATTFRRPDGSMPPPMSIAEGHPAFAMLANAHPFVGEVPVMGRLRLAYLTPILDINGAIAGALAVDVGWADDLTIARDELRVVLFGSALLVLVLVAGLGIYFMTREMRPLRNLAQFANAMASREDNRNVPYIQRTDEIGTLAHGLSRAARLQDELAYLAYTDTLTGLGNRPFQLQTLDSSIEKTKAGEAFALLHIDLVRFSRVNAAYGSATGDQVLRSAGSIMASTLNEWDETATIARQGDDKFAILVEQRSDLESAPVLAEKLISALAKPIKIDTAEVQLDAAIGICLLPQHAIDGDQAIRRANLALRHAMAPDAQRWIMFSPDLTDDTARELFLESSLRRAVEEGGLHLNYQPQIDPKSGRPIALEALARWTHPVEGAISPVEFIPVAERSGLIVELGDWVLHEASKQARFWLDQGLTFGHVSVNVSAIQLLQRDFVEKVESCLNRNQLDGYHLCIEVTESVFADADDHNVAAVLERLRALGVMLSLDDFGSGYSSLGYLNNLPFDQLKIDRSFVRNACEDRQRQKLLKGIVALGNGLGLSVVAEGAETACEVAMVEELGVAAIQGYFYSRPIPDGELEGVLRDIRRKSIAGKDAA